MSNYKVSVIIPIYNVECYIKECIDSVIAQIDDDIEIVLVNDGSTDNSAKIADYYTKFNNVKLLHQENKGLGAARNTGIMNASGEYILFLDSDDMIKEYTIKKMYEKCAKNQLDILLFSSDVFTDSNEMKNDLKRFNYDRTICIGEVINGKDFFSLTHSCNEYRVSVCMRMYRREYLNGLGLKFREGVIHEDEDYSLLSLLQANRVMAVNSKYYMRRVRPNSIMTASSYEKHLCAYLEVFDVLEESVRSMELSTEQYKQVMQFLVNLLYICFIINVNLHKEGIKIITYEIQIKQRAKKISFNDRMPLKYKAKLFIMEHMIKFFTLAFVLKCKFRKG